MKRGILCILAFGLLLLGGCAKSASEAFQSGAAAAQAGDHDKAIADFSEAIRLDPKRADAYYGRGTAYGHKGEYDKAIADYHATPSGWPPK